MNIFITGSNGFVGSHLKEYLSQNYSKYTLFVPSSKELDLADESAVDDYILSNKIDIIIHLANRGGGRDTLDMKNVTEYNLRISQNMKKMSKKSSLLEVVQNMGNISLLLRLKRKTI